MNNITTNVHIYALKSANSAANILIRPLTPYHSPHYDLYKYTEVKISSYHRKLNHEQKFSPPVLPILKTKTRLKVFRHLPYLEQSGSTYKKTIWILKVFICGGGDLENLICILSFQRAACCPEQSARNTTKQKWISLQFVRRHTTPHNKSTHHQEHGGTPQR